MSKFDGWALKNKRGSLLLWSASWQRKGVIRKINRLNDWKSLKEDGCSIVKIKLVEVKD